MDHVRVGVIAGTHGLRGEVKVIPRTDFPAERFRVGAWVELWNQATAEPEERLRIRSARPHKQFWLLSFEKYFDLSLVSLLRGKELRVRLSELGKLPDGMYYFHELVGLTVVTTGGTYLGELVEVLTPGANDVYVVRKPERRTDLLLPAIRECVLEVNLSDSKMVVHLLPGLLVDVAEEE